MSTLSLLISVLVNGFLHTPGKESDLIARSNQLDSLIVEYRASEAEKIYAENFILTASTGKRKIKADMLKDIANEKIRWETNCTTQIEVRILGETAVLTRVLHQKGKFIDSDFDFTFQGTHTWTRQNNEWILLAGHATVVAKPW